MVNKFVDYDKMSKKEKRAMDSKKRNFWAVNPVQKTVPNKKALNAKRACRVKGS